MVSVRLCVDLPATLLTIASSYNELAELLLQNIVQTNSKKLSEIFPHASAATTDRSRRDLTATKESEAKSDTNRQLWPEPSLISNRNKNPLLTEASESTRLVSHSSPERRVLTNSVLHSGNSPSFVGTELDEKPVRLINDSHLGDPSQLTRHEQDDMHVNPDDKDFLPNYINRLRKRYSLTFESGSASNSAVKHTRTVPDPSKVKDNGALVHQSRPSRTNMHRLESPERSSSSRSRQSIALTDVGNPGRQSRQSVKQAEYISFNPNYDTFAQSQSKPSTGPASNKATSKAPLSSRRINYSKEQSVVPDLFASNKSQEEGPREQLGLSSSNKQSSQRTTSTSKQVLSRHHRQVSMDPAPSNSHQPGEKNFAHQRSSSNGGQRVVSLKKILTSIDESSQKTPVTDSKPLDNYQDSSKNNETTVPSLSSFFLTLDLLFIG